MYMIFVSFSDPKVANHGEKDGHRYKAESPALSLTATISKPDADIRIETAVYTGPETWPPLLDNVEPTLKAKTKESCKDWFNDTECE